MRSIVSIANGGRPVLALGLCGSTVSTNTAHGTTPDLRHVHRGLMVHTHHHREVHVCVSRRLHTLHLLHAAHHLLMHLM
jgi:hypothetical protein